VGRKDTQPVPLASPLNVPSPEPPIPTPGSIRPRACSPNILQARTGLDIAGLETEKARAGHKPTLDLTASYNVSATSTARHQPASATASTSARPA
jgi:outer membrane protein